jgi:hypothetical protein
LLDYNEPITRAPGPQTPRQAPSSPPTPVPAPSTASPNTAGDDNEDVSVEEFIAALVQIQQEVQDAQQRAMLEEALRRRAEQQELEKRKAIFQALYLRGLLQDYASKLG